MHKGVVEFAGHAIALAADRESFERTGIMAQLQVSMRQRAALVVGRTRSNPSVSAGALGGASSN